MAFSMAFLQKYLVLISLSLVLLLSGCAPQVGFVKQSEQLSQAVYVVPAAFDAKRIDLAEKYSREATRLIAPPKHPVSVSEVRATKSGESLLIVPKTLSGQVVVVDSKEFKSLLSKQRETAAQLAAEQSSFVSYQDRVNGELIRKERAAAQLAGAYVDAKAHIKELQAYKTIVWLIGSLAGLAGVCYLAFIVSKKLSVWGWIK